MAREVFPVAGYDGFVQDAAIRVPSRYAYYPMPAGLYFSADGCGATLKYAIAISGHDLADVSAVLFRDEYDMRLAGRLVFDGGKLNLRAAASGGAYAGTVAAYGIHGGDLDASSPGTAEMQGAIRASARSRTCNATAAGIDAGTTALAALGPKFNLIISAAGGTGAAAQGMRVFSLELDAWRGGSVSVRASGGKRSARTGAEAHGLLVEWSISCGFFENTSFQVRASGGKANGYDTASASAVAAGIQATDILGAGFFGGIFMVRAKGGTAVVSETGNAAATAEACALSGDTLSIDGVLTGRFTVQAIGGKASGGVSDASASAFGVRLLYGYAAVHNVDGAFRMTVSATGGKAGDTATATAAGFMLNPYASHTLENISGTISVSATGGKADGTGAIAYGVATGSFEEMLGGGGMLHFTSTASLRLTVKAASASGNSTAFGVAAANFVAGDAGEWNVFGGVISAQSKGTACGIWSSGGISQGRVSGAVVAVGAGNGSDGATCAVYSADGAELEIYGAIYGGSTGNAAKIGTKLLKLVGTGKSAASLAKKASVAIVAGSGSSISVKAGAIVAGDILLGDGSSLEISSAAQIDGGISIATSGSVNFTIDGAASKNAAVSLRTGNGVFGDDSASLSITLSAETSGGRYVLLRGSDVSTIDTSNWNIVGDGVNIAEGDPETGFFPIRYYTKKMELWIPVRPFPWPRERELVYSIDRSNPNELALVVGIRYYYERPDIILYGAETGLAGESNLDTLNRSLLA